MMDGGGGGGGGGGSSKPAKRIARRQRKENVPRYNELTNALTLSFWELV